MPLPTSTVRLLAPECFDGLEEGTENKVRAIFARDGIDGVVANVVDVAVAYVSAQVQVMLMEQALNAVRDAGSFEGAIQQAEAEVYGGNDNVVAFPTGGKTPGAPGFYL